MVIPQDMSADAADAHIIFQENGQDIVLDGLSFALPVPGSLLTVYLRIIRQQQHLLTLPAQHILNHK